MSRFYCPSDNIKKDFIYIKGKESHHIYKVMRLRQGDKVIVFDGSAKEYQGSIVEAGAKLVKVKIEKINVVPAKRELNLSLAVSLPKGKKMDLIVQKSTELGVKEIMPFISQRSLISIDRIRQNKKIKRWAEIAKGASKQCGRIGIPEVATFKSYDGLLKEAGKYNYTIMPSVIEKTKTLKGFLESSKITKESKLLTVIGPEGGFSQNEIEKAKNKNFKIVSLGQRTLRTETAAIYIISILAFYLEG